MRSWPNEPCPPSSWDPCLLSRWRGWRAAVEWWSRCGLSTDFARFDVAVLFKTFGVMATPIYCTKIASKLARTYTDRHGLKDLTRELLGVELSKQQQSTDWGDATLSEAQLS